MLTNIIKLELSTNPDISIVIVSYNVKDMLSACLLSLKYFPSTISHEVIVVDNASTDETVRIIKEKFPQVHLILNKQNVGFPAANNQAFSVARGKNIFMLNPDTEFVDDSFSKMFDFIEKNTDTILAPQLLNTDRTIQNSVWRFPSLFSVFCESFHLSFLDGNKNYNDKPRNIMFEADSFSGAAILFRKDTLDKIGMLDEKLFWIEDVDFCYRARKAGYKLYYFPGTVLIHHIGASAKKNYRVSISNQVFNKIKFFKKYHTLPGTILIIVISFVSVLFKIIYFLFGSLFSVMHFRKLKAYCYTLLHIFNPPSFLK